MKAIERLYLYLDYKKIKPTNFEKQIGFSSGYLSVQRKRNADMGETIVNKINDYCHDLNIEWLITGKGEMIKNTHLSTYLNTHPTEENSKNNEVNDKKNGNLNGNPTEGNGKDFENESCNKIIVYGKNKAIEKNIQHQLIPIYNIEAAAGLSSLFNDYSSYVPVDYISLPNVGKVDGGLYAFGDSMYPLIKSGDIVVFRKIHDVLNNIFWGEMYLLSYDLEGEEYIVIKYIQKSEKEGYIKLVSQNQHHSPKDIRLDHIRALALVKASVRFNTMRL